MYVFVCWYVCCMLFHVNPTGGPPPGAHPLAALPPQRPPTAFPPPPDNVSETYRRDMQAWGRNIVEQSIASARPGEPSHVHFTLAPAASGRACIRCQTGAPVMSYSGVCQCCTFRGRCGAHVCVCVCVCACLVDARQEAATEHVNHGTGYPWPPLPRVSHRYDIMLPLEVTYEVNAAFFKHVSEDRQRCSAQAQCDATCAGSYRVAMLHVVHWLLPTPLPYAQVPHALTYSAFCMSCARRIIQKTSLYTAGSCLCVPQCRT